MGSFRRNSGASPYLEMISGVKLFRDTGGRVAISLCREDRNHPDLLRRSRQVNARGEERESLDWASLSGKDALVWQTFRPLEFTRVRLAGFLQAALASPASGLDLDPIQALDAARFSYWWRPGSDTGLEPYQIDVRIQVGESALIYLDTFETGEWEDWTSDVYPDRVLRSLDFGTAEARALGIQDFYLIAVTPSRDALVASSMRLRQYRDHPDLLRLALSHRTDLGLEDFSLLAGRIGWCTWREVEEWGNHLRNP